jgi:hypothetical protein
MQLNLKMQSNQYALDMLPKYTDKLIAFICFFLFIAYFNYFKKKFKSEEFYWDPEKYYDLLKGANKTSYLFHIISF